MYIIVLMSSSSFFISGVVIFSHCFISFHQGQITTAPTWKATPLPVVLFLILSVCILAVAKVKQYFQAFNFKSESRCSCLRQHSTPFCVCQNIYTSYTHTFTLQDSHLHLLAPTLYSSTHSALPLLLCRSCFFVCSFFMLTYVISVVCGLVVNLKICSMKNAFLL